MSIKTVPDGLIFNKAKEDYEYFDLEIKAGILYANFKGGKITYQDAIKMVKIRVNYTEGKNYPAVARSNKNMIIDKLAREYFRTNEGIRGMSSIALIYERPYTQILLSFLLKFYRPLIPMKSFDNYDDAFTWIKSLSNDR